MLTRLCAPYDHGRAEDAVPEPVRREELRRAMNIGQDRSAALRAYYAACAKEGHAPDRALSSEEASDVTWHLLARTGAVAA
jgi:hypothetical protein